MKFVLAGQPNSGKSTIFNSVAGYRAATANFPGSSVTFTVSRALILGREVSVIDLPGIYSLTSSEETAGEAERFLLEEAYDLIIDVMDASRLGRSLELTLQLLELERPMIVALNMMDEATRRGIEVDHEALKIELGIPVVPTIGRQGRGLRELFRGALQQVHTGRPSRPLALDRQVEDAIELVAGLLTKSGQEGSTSRRFTAEKLIERDPHFEAEVYAARPQLKTKVSTVVADLQNVHGWSADQVISGSRHAVAHRLEDHVVTMRRPKIGWRDWVDRLLLHPVTGGPLMVTILGALFWLVFMVGQRLEAPLRVLTERLDLALASRLPPDSLAGAVVSGALTGIAGGVALVLPYLIPFLIGLAILEDTGYLPRMAYILDSFMHRIGLHGKSVLPLILGYGCSVPAIMSARILESRRDRRITAVLASFIPCSARTIVIFGLVAALMGPWWALFVYLLNIVLVVLLGNILARTMKGRSPGLILEIPELRLPQPKTMAAKTWLTLKEFITIAWPLLVVSSVVLGLLEWAGAADTVNLLLSPLTVTLLGLPVAVGMTLVFGILRKELTLVMLVQALGTTQLQTVMTNGQLFTFTLFVVFYVPCVATIAVMAKELGWRDTGWIAAFSISVAVVVGVIARIGYALFA
ncbi:MAG: ferrous iron transport protein B [Thermoanaerobaculales bacterium]